MNKLTALLFFAITALAAANCNNAATADVAPVQQDTAAVTVKEDTVLTKLRPVLFHLQNEELSFNGKKPFDVTITSIRYSIISFKQYYADQQESLLQQAKYSTDKEKTQKALHYLTKMIQASNSSEDIFKVSFHLKAQVDKTNYNSKKILYLKKDLSVLQLIFPQ
jgi:hypothetical protein